MVDLQGLDQRRAECEWCDCAAQRIIGRFPPLVRCQALVAAVVTAASLGRQPKLTADLDCDDL